LEACHTATLAPKMHGPRASLHMLAAMDDALTQTLRSYPSGRARSSRPRRSIRDATAMAYLVVIIGTLVAGAAAVHLTLYRRVERRLGFR